MTRTGKIARLPNHIRTQLNRRLQDGEQGTTLVKWLNGLPPVQKILKDQFGGRPINEQNLTEWKQGGYEDWLRREESRAIVDSLIEQHNELTGAADGINLSDRFAAVLAVELVRLTRKLLEEKWAPQERWQCLREVLRELSQLRRDDHRAVRTAIKRDRWHRQVEREDQEALKNEVKEARNRLTKECLSGMQKGLMAQAFGGGERGEKMAALLHAIKFDLPFAGAEVPDPPHEPRSRRRQSAQTSSTGKPLDTSDTAVKGLAPTGVGGYGSGAQCASYPGNPPATATAFESSVSSPVRAGSSPSPLSEERDGERRPVSRDVFDSMAVPTQAPADAVNSNQAESK